MNAQLNLVRVAPSIYGLRRLHSFRWLAVSFEEGFRFFLPPITLSASRRRCASRKAEHGTGLQCVTRILRFYSRCSWENSNFLHRLEKPSDLLLRNRMTFAETFSYFSYRNFRLSKSNARSSLLFWYQWKFPPLEKKIFPTGNDLAF